MHKLHEVINSPPLRRGSLADTGCCWGHWRYRNQWSQSGTQVSLGVAENTDIIGNTGVKVIMGVTGDTGVTRDTGVTGGTEMQVSLKKQECRGGCSAQAYRSKQRHIGAIKHRIA